MFRLINLLKKKIESKPEDGQTKPTVKIAAKTWFEERYEIALMQRNWVFLMAILCIVGISVAAFTVTKISLSKEFDPFVIQIERNTGVAKVVNPIGSEALNGDDALARYFIKRYVVARETYNPVDYETIARKTIRLLSSGQIYSFYRGFINNKENDPSIKYGQKNTTYLTVKSWSKLDTQRYVLRFAITETAGKRKVYNKIAIVDYRYVPIQLKPGDEDINPVGFQVTGYRVDDDNS